MALVSDGFRLHVSLVDKGNNETSKTYELTSADYATAVTDAATILAALAGVSALVVGKYFLEEKYINDAFALPSSADAQAEVTASITTYIDGAGDKKANYNFPGPIAANVWVATSGQDSNIVKVSSPQVIAYQGLFTPGGPAYLSDGENAALTGLIGGIRVTRKRRGG